MRWGLFLTLVAEAAITVIVGSVAVYIVIVTLSLIHDEIKKKDRP